MYFMKDGNNVSLKITKNLISFCLNRPTFLYLCPYPICAPKPLGFYVKQTVI